MDDGVVLHVARAIRPHLRELLGDQAAEVDGQLTRLLKRSDEGHAVAPDVLRVIDLHTATREWAQSLFRAGLLDGGYDPVPGPVQYVLSQRYACPQFPECGTEFFRYSAAEPVPPCPVHGVELVQDAA